ncbi:hypothetical protein HYC85_019373 [Camellia sinensis]|uniref:Glycosyl hydrolase family 63 C-terminal domain-containing protein n=1 Tax=Camellia sinensis TaxID=4442 RepID=A0A7J7GP89_CAMSI|nr:hypothetical protein HYC85_019373 [Camellia sinensis]
MGNNHYASRELVQEVLEQPRLRFVPHIGYVFLFPFVAKIIPLVSCMKDLITKQCFLNLFVLLFSVSYLYTVVDSTILEQQLNLISNRSILWTDYGLRSLSKTR